MGRDRKLEETSAQSVRPPTSGAPWNSTPWMVSLSQRCTYLEPGVSAQDAGSGMDLLSPWTTFTVSQNFPASCAAFLLQDPVTT